MVSLVRRPPASPEKQGKLVVISSSSSHTFLRLPDCVRHTIVLQVPHDSIACDMMLVRSPSMQMQWYIDAFSGHAVTQSMTAPLCQHLDDIQYTGKYIWENWSRELIQILRLWPC